jgi:hypothetical protein
MFLKIVVHFKFLGNLYNVKRYGGLQKIFDYLPLRTMPKLKKLWSSLELNNEGYSEPMNTFHTLLSCINVNLSFSSNSDLHSLTFSTCLSNFSCYFLIFGAYEKNFASNFQTSIPAT